MEWRSANILFADVKGYSSLSDKQMKTFSESILGLITDRTKGLEIRDKNTWGDGIVLISDRISDICEAALALRDVFSTTNWKRFDLPRLDIRISVHHGEYLVGTDPFTGRTAFCGRTVVTAARIKPVTPPGRIWITTQAALMLRQHIAAENSDFFAVDEIGDITLAKKHGVIHISNLRRANEPKLSAEELTQIKDAEAMRLAIGGVADKDKDIADLISEKNIRSYEIVIGVVVRDAKVVLVRRKANPEGLSWMFPSGKKWPTEDAEYVVLKEVAQETGLQCTLVRKIAQVVKHPLTGYPCSYYLLSTEESAITNGDPRENDEVRWVSITDAIALLGQHANSEVVSYLRTI